MIIFGEAVSTSPDHAQGNPMSDHLHDVIAARPAPQPDRPGPRLFFEDFVPGSPVTTPGPTVTKDDIVAFAREFDPQPFHIDEAAAKDTFVGGLIASGWHTCALAMRMVADSFILDAAAMGAPGIDEVKWLEAVRPGDRLSLRRTVLDTRASRSRPDMGLVRFRLEVLNQHDTVVMTQSNWIMFMRRDAPPRANVEAPAKAAPANDTARPLPAGARADETASGMPFLDDVRIGDVRELGAHTFAADEIIRFAQRFDPQDFHVDPEAAKRSQFGGLIASGWHTAGAWMKLMVRDIARASEAALARGARPARLGPSPGFRDLKWLRPVYAGDTISYRATVLDKRHSASRPGWGLLFHHNTGINQRGEEVFSFRGAVFWERHPLP
jgi:acyl dehydratase